MMDSIVIRPVTDLSKNYKEVEKVCIEENLPVFLTKNGANHMVLMSHDYYEQLIAQFALVQKLLKANIDARQGKTANADEVLGRLQTTNKELLTTNEDSSTNTKIRG